MRRTLSIVLAILVMSGTAIAAPDDLIQSVHLSSAGPVYFGQPLDITMRGGAHGQAWWFLGSRQGRMTERSPGVYQARYRVLQGEQGQARLRVALFLPDGRTAARDLGVVTLNGAYALTPVGTPRAFANGTAAGRRAQPPSSDSPGAAPPRAGTNPADTSTGSTARVGGPYAGGTSDPAFLRTYVAPFPDQVMAQVAPPTVPMAALPYGYVTWPDQPSWLAQPRDPTYSVYPASFYGEGYTPYAPPYYGYGLPYGVPTYAPYAAYTPYSTDAAYPAYPSSYARVQLNGQGLSASWIQPSPPLYAVDPLGMGYLMSAPPTQLALTPQGLFSSTPSGWTVGLGANGLTVAYAPRAVFLAPALPVPVVTAYHAPLAVTWYDTHIVPVAPPTATFVTVAPRTIFRPSPALVRQGTPPYGHAWGYWARRTGFAVAGAWSGTPRIEVESGRHGNARTSVHVPHAKPPAVPAMNVGHAAAPRSATPPTPASHPAPTQHGAAPRLTTPPSQASRPAPVQHAAPRHSSRPAQAYRPAPVQHAAPRYSSRPAQAYRPAPVQHAAPRHNAQPPPAYRPAPAAPRYTAPAAQAHRPARAAPQVSHAPAPPRPSAPAPHGGNRGGGGHGRH